MEGSVSISYSPTAYNRMAATYYSPDHARSKKAGGQWRPYRPHQDREASTSRAGPSSQSQVVSQQEWSPSLMRLPSNYSGATLENARYHVDGIPTSDHTNEDRHFALDGGDFQAFGVFDGHDGPRAAGFTSNFIMELFTTRSWKTIVSTGGMDIVQALPEFFRAAERDFFNGLRRYIEEKNALQAVIPADVNSYQAYQLYPLEVARLQELEPKIAGGTTVAVAVICNNKLYVANVGDSRVVLIREKEDGTLIAEQLTVDHTVQNWDELRRLEDLGLDPNELTKAGRLGSQENTRSIGDYKIKEGYQDVDILRHAAKPPGTAQPYVMHPREIDESFRYLIVMSDGVYKSMEDTFEESRSIDANKVLIGVMQNILKVNPKLETVADRILERLAKIHKDTYQKAAQEDVRSPRAVTCRKRDDMTLLVYKFPYETTL